MAMAITARELERELSVVFGRPVSLASTPLHALSPASLKKAWFRRVHECHPDKAALNGRNPLALETEFRMLKDAYARSLDWWHEGRIEELMRGIHRSPFTASATAKATATATAKPRSAATAPATRRPPLRHGSIPHYPLKFAQYLLYAGKIDRETLIRALVWQCGARRRLGELAVELGYLSDEEVRYVLLNRNFGEPFGQAAMRIGFLRNWDLMVLMGRQRLLDKPIGRYFVMEGYLGEEELPQLLEAHARHNFFVKSGIPAR